VAARLWARGSGAGGASVTARVEKALARRAPLLEASAQAATDAFRLIHGEADGFPALFVDRLGPLLRVLVTGRACDLVREEAVGAVIARLEALLGRDPPVVEVIHLRERPRAELECVRLARGALRSALRDPAAGGLLAVRERGLRFLVDPGLARPTTPAPGVGLFLDQRVNRERLAGLARKGGRWLNLFAHTGAFSAALLAAGADEVLSVDAAPAQLRWLEANLRENGLETRPHRALRSDARRFFEGPGARERFRGIVLDPPTAASGRRFWSVRRDLVALAAACLARLEPGGWLLACRNDRAGRGRLRATLEEAAQAARVELAAVEPAPPGPDFPSLAGFPEGDPFEGVLARVAG
jgi:23S rRNA (cytosine1962-C5)-methyltransferase